MHQKLIRPVACAAALLFLSAQVAEAQAPAAPAPPAAPPGAPAAAPAGAPPDQQSPVFSQQELDQLMAPIALYPDDLLAMIFMASTYPLQIVQADRWVKKPENAKLKGDQLSTAVQQQPWDPSVMSLVQFPQVLDMMNENLDWTQKVGDAVLAQQQDVMASVQRLRRAADSAGNLKTTEQQVVKTDGQAIVIQPANPQVVYVPTYNPQDAFGTWPYPSYPPTYYPPPPAYYPGYYGGAVLGGALAFATGVAVGGAIWGWGNTNWGGGNINVNYNQFNNINRNNINAGRATTLPAGSNRWQHNPNNRGGVPYRDAASRQNFQRASTGNARQNLRGFDGGAGAGNRPGAGGIGNRPGGGAGAGAGAGRPGAGAGATRPGGGAGATRPGGGAGAGATRPGGGAGAGVTRPGGGAGAGVTRPGGGAGGRPSAGTGAITRPSAGAGAGARPGSPAFSGMNNGRAASTQAARGAASRSSFSGGGGGGRSYGGGGGARAGGGGGRGGGGGGRGGGRR